MGGLFFFGMSASSIPHPIRKEYKTTGNHYGDKSDIFRCRRNVGEFQHPSCTAIGCRCPAGGTPRRYQNHNSYGASIHRSSRNKRDPLRCHSRAQRGRLCPKRRNFNRPASDRERRFSSSADTCQSLRISFGYRNRQRYSYQRNQSDCRRAG